MTTRTVKLADLIAKGRSAPAGVEMLALHTEAPGTIASKPAPRPADDRNAAVIAHGIERLAIELLSLSKTRGGDPRAMMIAALRSIDTCLVEIAGKS